MNPKFHCGGKNIQVLKNEFYQEDGVDMVMHLCVCSKCGQSFGVGQTVEQWKRD